MKPRDFTAWMASWEADYQLCKRFESALTMMDQEIAQRARRLPGSRFRGRPATAEQNRRWDRLFALQQRATARLLANQRPPAAQGVA